MYYEARNDAVGELFSEEYERDRGGRITAKTVRIRKPDGSGMVSGATW